MKPVGIHNFLGKHPFSRFFGAAIIFRSKSIQETSAEIMDPIQDFSFDYIFTVIPTGMTVDQDPLDPASAGCYCCNAVNGCRDIQIYHIIVFCFDQLLHLPELGYRMSQICDGKDSGMIPFKIFFQFFIHFIAEKIYLYFLIPYIFKEVQKIAVNSSCLSIHDKAHQYFSVHLSFLLRLI